MSEFQDVYQSAASKAADASTIIEDMQKVYDRTLEISGDGSGSDPELYLGKSMSEECTAFLGAVASNMPDHDNADRLEFFTKRTGGILWKEPSKANVGLIARGFTHAKDVFKGYRIGSVELKDVHASSPLVLRTDGLLVCERTPAIFPKSYGFGYGTLPSLGVLDITLTGESKWKNFTVDRNGKPRTEQRARAAAFSSQLARFMISKN